jgi:hypothetical protein
VQAVATVTSSSGGPVEGVVVTFSEGSAALLAFAPQSATALTDDSGVAVLDLSAASATSTGATTVNASAMVASTEVTGSKSIQITAGAGGGGALPVPAAINFVGSNPSDTALVVKGSGGNGRSEAAILTFRVVDATGAPINAASVGFELNGVAGGAQISPAKGVSNSEGLVTASVTSGTEPTSIVVTATVAGTQIKTQSDTLIVSNSVPAENGFEAVAAKYNLDGRRTGDSTTITAFVRDEFGNSVPDGVAVSFVTDYGVVGSSTLGGCTTTNGRCIVDFRVQDPRGDGIATVVGSVRVDDATQFQTSLSINMAAATGTSYLALDPASGNPVTGVEMTSCKQSFELLLSDGAGRSTAAGTVVSAPFASSEVKVTVKSGSPVLDQLAANFPPTTFGFEVDLTSEDLAPLCNPDGAPAASNAYFRLAFQTPGGIVFSQRIELAYPQ